jgi:peptide/nickel transport system permease protein
LRNSLLLGLVVAFFSTLIGVLAGLLAGYSGGIVDRVVSFLMDALLSIPTLPILILLAALFGGQLALPVIAVALICSTGPTRPAGDAPSRSACASGSSSTSPGSAGSRGCAS